MFVHVGLENITMGMPQPCARRLGLGLNLYYVGASHGYILRAHMNEHTLLDNVMSLAWRQQIQCNLV